MYKIGIISNIDKDVDYIYAGMLANKIKQMGGQPILTPKVTKIIGEIGFSADLNQMLKAAEVVICLGGDGTFLKVARDVYKSGLPILGINLGSMGFLTEVEKSDIDIAVKSIIEDNIFIEKRMMLDTVLTRNNEIIGRNIALNDVVISRGALSRILHVKTYINDDFVDTFPGDGLIVSSPTGSTGYSLSAGGPIVEPDIDMIIVTPICPHILYTRSFITTGDRAVKAIVDENYSHIAMVTIDGQKGYEVRGGDIIETKKSEHVVKMVRINKRNFFNVLRTKIYYRGVSLAENEI